jgi:hypothetical protein
MAEPFWAPFEAVAHTLPYDAAVMGETMAGKPLAPDCWQTLDAPVLAMAGGASPDYQRDAVEDLAAVLPAGCSLIVDGQTHAFAPIVLASVVAEFFAE